MAVLVVALESDLHADAVVDQLLNRGIAVVRIDPTEDRSLPSRIRITSSPSYQAIYEFDGKDSLDTKEISGVFCRFAIDSLTPTDERTPLQCFSASEELSAFLAPLRMIEPTRWINDPWAEARADCRLLQTSIARSLGLQVPEWIVSSSYEELAAFHRRYPEVVIKPLSDAPLALAGGKFVAPEHLRSAEFSAPYAVEFVPIPREFEDVVDGTPTLLQVRVPKKADIRATVVDGNVFAAEIPYRPGKSIDFRLEPNATVRPFDLSPTTSNLLVRLVAQLGLRFASCDLVLDERGQVHFLESNVSGNWLWTELGADLSISAALAKALTLKAEQPIK